MEPLDIMLVGCGMMGTRHLRGYAELEHVRAGSLRLRAVCDPCEVAAGAVAEEAEKLLGYRPRACASAEEALRQEPGIVAADVVTDNRSHRDVVVPLLEAGLHVQVEKPLAVTVGLGREMVDAAQRTERILAVAENNRRDPMNRLLRHVVSSGFIGAPYFVSQMSVVNHRAVFGTPWRHDWRQGGLALDVAIHLAYMLEYIAGKIDTVFAVTQRVLAEREWTPAGGSLQMVPAESDDVFSALLTFADGAQGTWTTSFASAGAGQWQRRIYGTAGTADGPGDRSGQPVSVQLGTERIEGEELVRALPDFRLNDVEARLFSDRPSRYDFAGPETDRKLIAAETADFLDAVRDQRRPEVPAEVGLRSIAIALTMLESAAAGQPIRIDDVAAGRVNAFQRDVIVAAVTEKPAPM